MARATADAEGASAPFSHVFEAQGKMARTLVVVYFAGMRQSRVSASERNFAEFLGRSLVSSEPGLDRFVLVVLTPPLVDVGPDQKRLWAEYSPEDGEAYWDTSRVRKVEEWMALTCGSYYRDVEVLSERHASFLWLGFSNGCIPAFEFAKFYKERYPDSRSACVLLNGCPARCKGREDTGFPFLMCVGDEDRMFAEGVNQYLAAWAGRGNVISFSGGHTNLPPKRLVSNVLNAMMRAKSPRVTHSAP